ncbi:MAG TPA: hypothetical protein VIF62_20900, partial [Labilithrix sp.]
MEPIDSCRTGESLLGSTAARFGGTLETLVNGVHVAVVICDDVATDQAVRATRCAQAMRAVVPELAVAVVAGHVTRGAQAGLGDVIDRGASLLSIARAGEIRLDETVAGLLDSRFDVGRDAAAYVLRSPEERAWADGTRTLLGRPTP